MATIAVFLVLSGGAAYAAGHLAKNSVGTKQLKKNAVKTAKIKNNAVTLKKIKKNSINSAKVKKNSLTGSDINLNKLTVPGRWRGVAVEPIHVIGAPAAFRRGDANPQRNPQYPYTPAGFKDHEEIVHLVGRVAIGVGPSCFTLPPGYRPAPNTLEPTIPGVRMAGSGVNANVGYTISEGDVYTSSNSPEIDTLSGITFRAES